MRKILTWACLMAMSLSLFAQKDASTKQPLPDTGALEQITDSILQEGLRLYVYEHLAWVSADSLYRHCPLASEINGSGVTVDSSAVFQYFYTRDDDVVFSYYLDIRQGVEWWEATPHAMTDDERNAKRERKECINLAIRAYGDSIYEASSSQGNFNVDVIRVSPEVIRVYFLQGTTLNIIPLGNDYSVDINRDMEVIGFRRYHHSFIPISVSHDGKVVTSVVHSHTPDNPFITPTDICNFLLYGRDYYGITTHYVLSTAFQEQAIWMFDADSLTVRNIDYESFKKMSETDSE